MTDEGYEWIEENMDEVASFWIINTLRDMFSKHHLLTKGEILKGFKIEWELGKDIEIKTLVPIKEN